MSTSVKVLEKMQENYDSFAEAGVYGWVGVEVEDDVVELAFHETDGMYTTVDTYKVVKGFVDASIEEMVLSANNFVNYNFSRCDTCNDVVDNYDYDNMMEHDDDSVTYRCEECRNEA